jgi:deazaflavin-dependent oxidoreductase (nitroreductase family)
VKQPKNSEYWRDFNARVIAEFRANDGRVGGDLEEANLILLTTTGAKSRQQRLVPLAAFTINDMMIIVGSKGGADHHPDWVHNLRCTPRANVESATEAYDVIARELPRDQRDRIYQEIVAQQSRFGEYQDKTSRTIPLFELQRA